MKKFLTIAAVAVFILTLAAATYAVDFKASGFIRVRPTVALNTNGAHLATNAAFDKSAAYVDERFRLQMQLVANEDLYGVIYIEGDSSQWGEVAGGRNAIGSWGSDRPGIEAKQFYIDFNVPGIKDTVPTNLRVGMQWFAIRSHVFMGIDAPGIRLRTDVGPVRVYLNWLKAAEGNTWQSHDETDLYAARVVLNLPDFPVKPGMFVAYWNGNDYPLVAGTQNQRADFYWVGVNADGKVGPASFQADFVYVSGDVDRTSAGLQDREYAGWVFYADANLPVAMMTVGGTFMYATGDDVTDATAAAGDLEHDGYVVPPATEGNPNNMSQVFWQGATNDGIWIARGGNTAGMARTSGTQVMPRYWGGLWTIKGYASIKPLDWLKVSGYAMYIGDTTSDGNTVGNAVTAAGLPEDDDYIGIEVGAIADMKVYKELTYSVGVGYLFAGDAMDSYTGVGTVNDTADDPWAILTQLIYKF